MELQAGCSVSHHDFIRIPYYVCCMYGCDQPADKSSDAVFFLREKHCTVAVQPNRARSLRTFAIFSADKYESVEFLTHGMYIQDYQ
jgi:hypothetical protein